MSVKREDVQTERDLEVMKVQFNEQFNSERVEKDVIKKSWTADRVREVIEDIKTGKLADLTGSKKSSRQYYSLRKYDVLPLGVNEHLVIKRSSVDQPIVYIIPIEQYFDVLLECHRSSRHGGRDKMVSALKNRYNIPRRAVEIFISLCKECKLKKSQKGAVRPSILSKDFNVCGQLDLIDFQSASDGNYRWLLNYQDYATKFLHLRPLHTKTAAEVATELVKIFLEFGAPHTLQNDDDQEFTASVLKEIVTCWPDCKIVYGKSSHPQSEERSNLRVKMMMMLRSWMSDNSSTNWSTGCYFVQWQINSSRHGNHGNIERTPYRALFGADPKLCTTKLGSDSSLSSDENEYEVSPTAQMETDEQKQDRGRFANNDTTEIEAADEDMNLAVQSSRRQERVPKFNKNKGKYVRPKQTMKPASAGTSTPSVAMVKILKNMYDQQIEKRNNFDEFDIYGELVARKLRNLSSRYAQITVQAMLNKIIYDAELGKYDTPLGAPQYDSGMAETDEYTNNCPNTSTSLDPPNDNDNSTTYSDPSLVPIKYESDDELP